MNAPLRVPTNRATVTGNLLSVSDRTRSLVLFLLENTPREAADEAHGTVTAVSSTQLTQRVNAPRAAVYRALLDAESVRTWMVPTGMTSEVHQFDPREGGAFRISLSYDVPTGTGKTSAHTDTYHGRFVALV